MTNTIIVLLVVAICLGFLLGLSAATVFNLIVWMAFWFVTGTVLMLLVDVAAGIGPHVSVGRAALRSWLRRREGLSPRRRCSLSTHPLKRPRGRDERGFAPLSPLSPHQTFGLDQSLMFWRNQ
jgi:hypothetical protein